jgi:hypothetical protein
MDTVNGCMTLIDQKIKNLMLKECLVMRAGEFITVETYQVKEDQGLTILKIHILQKITMM